MVKRAKSPEIVEEARYFTVCQPFPLNANWVFDKDQQDCATWIAECIGLEHLYAIHYKPSARGMVLLEVSKEFTEHERLLGEHRWSEILTHPDDEENDRVSQVFHSFYAKGRDAQKDGWKVLLVQSNWFKSWVPGKGRFKQPYPPTRWCPIPVEDQTNKQLCRPLPVDKMPPPPRAEPPVVGSSTWAQKKTVVKPTVEALKMSWDEEVTAEEAMNKLEERAQGKLNAGRGGSTVTSPSTPTARSPPATPTTPNLVPLGKNKKNKKAVPLNQFMNNGEGSKKSTPATWKKVPSVVPVDLNEPAPEPTPRSAIAWNNPIKFKVPLAPEPKKKETPLADYSSWGQEPAVSTIDQENIWKSPPPSQQKSKKGKNRAVTIPETTTPASSTSQGSTQPSSPQAWNLPISSVIRDIPPHMDLRALEGDEDDSDYDDTPFPSMRHAPPAEMRYVDLDLGEGEGSNTQLDSSETSDAATAREVDEIGQRYQNLWASEDDPRAVPTPALICPVHHIACKKGICEEMSNILRGIEREKKKAEWEEKKKNKGKKKRRGASESDDNDDNDDNDDDNNNASEVQVDGDNFTMAGPRGNRGGFGKQKGKQEVNEPSYTGRMRAFSPDQASGSAKGGAAPIKPEGQLFDQW